MADQKHRSPAPDLQSGMIDGLEQAIASMAAEPPELPPLDAGYLVPMLVHAARSRGNTIVDHVPRESFADHNVNWYGLAAALAQAPKS